jgi:hypothetical protein
VPGERGELGEQDGLRSRVRRLLPGLAAFAVVGAGADPVTRGTGWASRAVATAPTATPLPTSYDVEVVGVTTAPGDPATLRIALGNRGRAVQVVAARLEGAGYETQEAAAGSGVPGDVAGVIGLGVDDIGDLAVLAQPTCGAGIGVERRPELVLVLRGHDGAERTTRTPLTAELGVPDDLLGRCDAPLGTGARVEVVPLPVAGHGHLRLRITLVAGRGLLWLDGLDNRGGLSFDGFTGFPVIVTPGGREALDLTLTINACSETTRPGGDPLALAVGLRTEPGKEPRSLRLVDVGGETYLRAVRAAVARACP